MIAVRTLYTRRERAVNTLQQLLARRTSVMDATQTLYERRVDAVGTLWGHCVYAISGNCDIFRSILRRPQSALTGFQNAVQTLWHRRLVWQGLYCYIILVNSILCVDFSQLI